MNLSESVMIRVDLSRALTFVNSFRESITSVISWLG
jgi:hypothetical protein